MSLLRKHWRKFLAVVFILTLVAIPAMIVWAGEQIASPTRRPILDYHRKILDAPAAHGLLIRRFTASDGTPCLVCEATGSPGERGLKIRRELTARGIALPGYGSTTGTLVLLHGRKGRKEDYLSIAERLCATGFRCIIPDLPAHGEHPGHIATYGIREAELPARLLAETSANFHFTPQPAGLLGLSMGGSVAIHSAALPEAPWRALVVIASFDSLPAVIEGQAGHLAGTTLGPLSASATAGYYHWKTGVPLDAVQPQQHTPRIHIPTLIAHGTRDETAPLASGRHLFDTLPATTPKAWLEIPGAGHDNVLVTDFPVYAEIAGWMIRYLTIR